MAPAETFSSSGGETRTRTRTARAHPCGRAARHRPLCTHSGSGVAPLSTGCLQSVLRHRFEVEERSKSLYSRIRTSFCLTHSNNTERRLQRPVVKSLLKKAGGLWSEFFSSVRAGTRPKDRECKRSKMFEDGSSLSSMSVGRGIVSVLSPAQTTKMRPKRTDR